MERVIREAGERPTGQSELIEANAWSARRCWVALTLGDASRIDDAREAREGRFLLPPLFYVARSRIAPRQRSRCTRPARTRLRSEWAWRRRVDEPLDRLLARRRSARTNCCSRPGPSPTTTTRSITRSSLPDDACTRLLLDNGAQGCQERTRFGTRSTTTGSNRVRLLLEGGGEPNESPDWPALHHAVIRGRFTQVILRLLVEYGADRSSATATVAPFSSMHCAEAAKTSLRHCESSAGPSRPTSPTLRSTRSQTEGRCQVSTSTTYVTYSSRSPCATSKRSQRRRQRRPELQRAMGGGPRGTLLHQAAGRPPRLRRAPPTSGSRTRRTRGDRLRDAARLGSSRFASQPRLPERQLFGASCGSRDCGEAPRRSGAELEPKFSEMALPPLSDWLYALTRRARRDRSSRRSRRLVAREWLMTPSPKSPPMTDRIAS